MCKVGEIRIRGLEEKWGIWKEGEMCGWEMDDMMGVDHNRGTEGQNQDQ